MGSISRVYKPISFFLIILLISVTWYFSRPEGLFSIGNFLFGGGAYDIKLAKKFFNLARDKNPELPGLNYQLGRVYFIEGDFATAWFFLDKEIKNNPDFIKSYYMRGLVFGYTNHLGAAVDDFSYFLEKKPSSWAAANDLSWVYFKMGNFKKMEETARKGLSYSRTNPWLLNSLGLALFNEGRTLEAQYYFSESLKRFEGLSNESWGRAYPGNNPKVYKEGLSATIDAVKENLRLSENEKSTESVVDKTNSLSPVSNIE